MYIACLSLKGGHGGNRSSDEAEQDRAGNTRANIHSSQSRGMVRGGRPDATHQASYDQPGNSKCSGTRP